MPPEGVAFVLIGTLSSQAVGKSRQSIFTGQAKFSSVLTLREHLAFSKIVKRKTSAEIKFLLPVHEKEMHT
jgi:hypothetical protein